MRAILWASAVGATAFILVYFVTRGKPAPSLSSSSDAIAMTTLFLNVIWLLVSLAALYIALASYQDARKAGEQQQRALEASRKALEATASTASAQLELVRQQREEEIQRQRRAPHVEIGLSKYDHKQLQSMDKIDVPLKKGQTELELDFTVVNKGDAPAYRPVLVMSAKPASLVLHPRGQRLFSRPDGHVLQFSGRDTNDILPFDRYDRPYLYPVDISVPDDVDAFQLEVLVYAENLKVQRLTIGFNVGGGA